MSHTVISAEYGALLARGPAFAVIRKCLSIQEDAAPLGRLATFFGLSPLSPDARSWYRGAIGELEVARALDRLRDGWTVLHAVPVGMKGADIDHVAIGPGGVFTINTKNHSGRRVFAGGHTFRVDGYKQDHLHNSEHEAARASKLLSEAFGSPISVTPLLVVVGADALTIGSTDPVVEVLESGELGRWLHRRKRVLSNDAVAAIVQVAGQPFTWSASPSFEDTDTYAKRFELLRRRVDAAAHRARIWAAAGTLVALAVLTAFMLNVLPALMVGAFVR